MWHIVAKADICPNAVETESTSIILRKHRNHKVPDATAKFSTNYSLNSTRIRKTQSETKLPSCSRRQEAEI